MDTAFFESLGRSAGVILPIIVMISVLVFLIRRKQHIEGLRAKVRGEVPLPTTLKDVLKGVFTPEITEAGAIGAVTFVDLAWQYSLVEPAVWDHLGSAAAERLATMSSNLDVMANSLGVLRLAEATHLFSDMLHSASESLLVEAPATGIVDALADTASSAEGVNTGLLTHIPVVTVGFATYRAWRRSQQGTGVKRNVEFAAVEVATRAGGGLAGAKVGGTVGTVIAPGVGTVVGSVAGAVVGTLSGALLGEAVKKRHIDKANRDLQEAVNELGATYLHDDQNFTSMVALFHKHEATAETHIDEVEQRYRRYRTPWRIVWPDERLILLEETLKLAEARLIEIRAGTVEAIDKLNYMRAADQTRELGMMIAANPALQNELNTNMTIIERVREATQRLNHEVTQLQGANP